jgi:ribosomal protein L40E
MNENTKILKGGIIMNEKKDGFKQTKLNSMLWKCPACKSFNPVNAEKCEKCGADKPSGKK